MTQGERVREIRKFHRLTLEKFGEKIGIKKNSVSQIENGINNLTEQIAKSICREFGVNYSWLTTEKGDMFEELTDQQKVAKYTELLLKDKDSVVANAIQTLIITYEQLDDTSKTTLEKIALRYMENLKRDESKIDDNSVEAAVKTAEAEYIKSRLDSVKKKGSSASSSTDGDGRAANQ